MQLAVFDLDGTITRRDTFLPYVLGFLARHPWRALGLVLTLPTLVKFVLGAADRGEVKSAVMRATLRGVTRGEIERWTDRFVETLLTRGVYRKALEQIEAHRQAGDELVLLSASPDLYVPAIGRKLGFTQTVCTGVRWNGDRLDGHLTTANRRGMEKVHVVTALRASKPGKHTVAYGNAVSDLPHLELVDRGLLVNGTRRARREAARRGVPTASWR